MRRLLSSSLKRSRGSTWPSSASSHRGLSSLSSSTPSTSAAADGAPSGDFLPFLPPLPPPRPLPPLPFLPPPAPLSPLTDLHARRHSYLRISLTERCSLRCVYCMPEEGIELTKAGQLLSSQEIDRLLRWFVQQGVTKVRFTGGEPLVRRDVVDVVAAAGRLRPLGLSTIGLTTNGLVLQRQLPALVDAGLTHLNLSLDTLDPDKFELIARRKGHSRVVAALHAALAEPRLRRVKLNCVLMRGINDDEVEAFVELTRHHALEVRFIEFMPFDGNGWKSERMVGYAELLAKIRATHPSIRPLESTVGEVSKVWRVDGFTGSVGFISSMTEDFCATCTRLRITADGQLKVCLHDNAEVSLRDAMREGRSDDEMKHLIAQAVRGKKAKHAGMLTLASSKNRSMIRIGG